MSNACTSILVGMTSPVSEILVLSKTAKFPFLTMDYSPWSSKNLVKWNRLKKFMQVGVDDKCMHKKLKLKLQHSLYRLDLFHKLSKWDLLVKPHPHKSN